MDRRSARRTALVAAAALTALGIGLGVRHWSLDGGEAGDRTARRPDPLAGEDRPASDTLAPGPTAAMEGSVGGRSDLAPSPVDLMAVDRNLDLHGTVVDAAGRPIVNATLVTVVYPFRRASILAIDRYDDAVEGVRTRSAIDGTFAMRLHRGATVALRVAAAGHAAVELPYCHAGERRRVVLPTGVTLVVEATDAGKKPVADATFRLFRPERRGDSSFQFRAKTGADGRARFEDLPPSLSAWLELESSRQADFGWKDVVLPASGTITMKLELPAGRTLTGRVIDAESKAPIEGARVGMNWTLHRAVKTDADGRYTLSGWSGQGIQDVHVLAEGYGRRSAVVGHSTVVDFALSKGDSVVGRVVGPDGGAVAGATIAVVGSINEPDGQQRMSTANGSSGTDGRFALAGLSHDLPHTLIVMGAGFGRTLLDFDPRPEGPGAIDVGDVRVSAARLLAGSVVTHEGTPVAAVSVELKGANADRDRNRPGSPPLPHNWYGREETDFTDDLGRFRFADLAPGTYYLSADGDGISASQLVVLISPDGDPAPVEFRLPAGRNFRLEVVDDTGAPIPWAQVSVTSGDEDRESVVRLDARATASFAMEEHAKLLTVRAWDPPGGDDERRFLHAHREFPIEPGQRSLRVVFEAGARIHGKVVRPDGTGVANAAMEVLSGDDTVASGGTESDGAFDITVPKKGTLLVRLVGASWDGRNTELGLVGERAGVVPGAEQLVITATPVVRGLDQDVSVVDPEGKPVAGASVWVTWSDGAGRAPELRTAATGHVVASGLPGRSCRFHASHPAAPGDLIGGQTTATIPSVGTVEVRLRHGLRVNGRVVVPEGVAMPIRIHIIQRSSDGLDESFLDVTDSSKPTFTILLDPDDGVLASVEATVGSTFAPTHRARIEGPAIVPGEIVLTLAAVN